MLYLSIKLLNDWVESAIFIIFPTPICSGEVFTCSRLSSISLSRNSGLTDVRYVAMSIMKRQVAHETASRPILTGANCHGTGNVRIVKVARRRLRSNKVASFVLGCTSVALLLVSVSSVCVLINTSLPDSPNFVTK